ncbi:TPA: restriction endonuclease subunit S [Bacillus paranthracis]|nr:restriction endonuclease subunit S [Bacillus paranthracis]
MSKKKQTIEEEVAEALVPKEEQPYNVPENWLWSKIDSLFELKSGKSIDKNDESDFGELLYVKVSDMNLEENSKEIRVSNRYVQDSEKYKKALIPPKSVIFPKRGGAILTNKKRLVNKEILCDLNIMAVISNKSIDESYLYYWFLTVDLAKLNNGSSVPQINNKDIGPLNFPLPPLNEQKRIAEKVECLLNKVEEAKQLVEEVKETFELRRAAILDKAFRGELTKKWRKENSFQQNEEEYTSDNELRGSKALHSIPKTWKWTKLKDIATFKNGYAFKSKDFVEQGIQLIRMGNLYKNELRLDRNPVYIPLDFDEKILEKYAVENGDILLSLTGTKYKRDYGYAVRVSERDESLLLNQRILSLKPHFMDQYIYYYLQSSVFRDVFFSFETGGVNQGNVGSKVVESILIPLPSIDEAKEIEKQLARLLNNEKESLMVLNVEEQLETLKQSILSKAFRGELGTNDSSEESAIELLKEVLQEKIK